MARTKQPLSGDFQRSNVLLENCALGDATASEMPSLEMEAYSETIQKITEVEAIIKKAQLLPFLYGPQDHDLHREEMARWMEELKKTEGELNLAIPCPINGCIHHAQIAKLKNNCNFNLISTPTKNPNLNLNKKRQLDVSTEGFKIPSKTAKQSQAKIVTPTINETLNKFNTLRINNQVDVAEAIPPPIEKIPPVMLHITQKNYNLLKKSNRIAPVRYQQINGNHIKFFLDSSDEHREISLILQKRTKKWNSITQPHISKDHKIVVKVINIFRY
ncbi:hypothetical protein NPIL_680991 [Nephila pilipes]|uniref:Uncharacterized protein n=1 Tax=Nephila pilipes TaxID=299642 RepID=A0A8X6NN70_NEPPI|nr:hypothetical protein NPIL_680991 [Nephila pilipes]